MKTLFITGGSSGIGSGIVSLFESKGWKVIAPAHKDLDLTDAQKVAGKTKSFTKNVAKIDALIHVAGVWHDESQVYANKKLEKFSTDQIIDTINVGLTSFMVLSQTLLPKISKSGVVIGISGTFMDGGAGWLPYYTSKRALEDFLVGLAQDYSLGPKVYGVSPADTATAAYKKYYPEYADEAQPVGNVARLCFDLVNDIVSCKSGDIIEIRSGEIKNSFHA